MWGIGHTITIFVVGSLIILLSKNPSPRVGLSMEFCVAVMLVLLGVLNLSGAMQKVTRFFTRARVQEPATWMPSIPSGSWLSKNGTAFGQLEIYHCFGLW